MVETLLFLAVVALVGFYAFTWDKKRKGKLTPEMKKSVELVEETLRSLNIVYDKKEASEKNFQYRFSFQGGHYILYVNAETRLANIVFPGVLTVKSGEMDLVRALCNHVNLNTFEHFLYYSYEESDNTMSVHISASVLLDSNITSFPSYFTSILTQCFAMRRQINDLYTQNGGGQNGGNIADPEEDHNDRNRVGFLMREIEIENQHLPDKYDYKRYETMTLGGLIRYMNGAAMWTILSMREVGDAVQTVTDPDTIDNYNLLDAITATDDAGNVVFTAENKVLLLNCVDTGGLRKRAHLVTLILEADLDTEQALYVRLTICVARDPLVVCEDVNKHLAEQASFTMLLARDKAGGKAKRAEFKYMWEDAKDKMHEGRKEEMTDEQKFVVTATTPSVGYNLYWGKKYFNDKRYYQASILFFKAWDELNANADTVAGEPTEAHREACFYLGMCSMLMGKYMAAYYFFDTLVPLQNIRYTKAFIDCIVRLNDFRAETIIGNFISSIRVPQEDETDDESERMRRFMHFLYRSKAIVLMHKYKLDEAETLFKQMLDNPEDADFALTQLAKIQKMREADDASDEETTIS